MKSLKGRIERMEATNPRFHEPVTCIDRVIIGENGEPKAVLRRERAEDRSGWTTRWLNGQTPPEAKPES